MSDFSEDEVRVLICGSRTWEDEWIVHRLLDGIADYHRPDFEVIEGGAKGADSCAATWVAGHGSEYPPRHRRFPADWATHGRAAGPIRNQQMLNEGKPNLVVAFRDGASKGTADMVRRAKQAGIRTYVVTQA